MKGIVTKSTQAVDTSEQAWIQVNACVNNQLTLAAEMGGKLTSAMMTLIIFKYA